MHTFLFIYCNFRVLPKHYFLKEMETMPGSASTNQVHDVWRVESSVVSCDGTSTGNNNGHPLVYLNMGEEDANKAFDLFLDK